MTIATTIATTTTTTTTTMMIATIAMTTTTTEGTVSVLSGSQVLSRSLPLSPFQLQCLFPLQSQFLVGLQARPVRLAARHLEDPWEDPWAPVAQDLSRGAASF